MGKSSMDYFSKPALRLVINSFLNQRRKAFTLKLDKVNARISRLESSGLPVNQQDIESRSHFIQCIYKINSIHQKFNFIRDWTYWRHCLEILNNEDDLITLLPSEKGGHRTHREHMLQLIQYAKEVASIPYSEYLVRESTIKKSFQYA